jgi:hypothetical protein
MKVWIFMALSVISAPAFAQEIGGSYPDLSITGIHNKDELSKYLNSLKAAAAAKDVAAISKSNIYPLRVNAKPKRKPINNEAELKKDFPSIFTSKVLTAITSQKFEELFCRDQGAMVGDGEAWLNERNGKIGITTINLE